MEDIITGTDLKLEVHIEPTEDGLTMDDFYFEVMFHNHNFTCTQTFTKDQLKRIDDEHYLAVIDTADLKCGALRMLVTAQIPDNDCPDGMRCEKKDFDTGFRIIRP